MKYCGTAKYGKTLHGSDSFRATWNNENFVKIIFEKCN